MNRAEDYARVRANEIPSPFSLPSGNLGGDLLRQAALRQTKEFYRLWSGKMAVANPIVARRTLIVGDSDAALRLADELKRHFPQHYSIVGVVTDAPGQVSSNGVPVLGSLHDISSFDQQMADEVLVADYFNPKFKETEENILALSAQCRKSEHPVLPSARTSSYKVVKRAIDVVVSLLALLIAGPILLLLGWINKLTAPGPIFFSQERVGLHGKRFNIYKLRTMRVDAEAQTGPVLAQHRDSRCTPVGAILRATHIDELPQLYNVLRGDMSMVGPRPERPVFVEVYERHVPGYSERHSVLPGLTGMAQTSGDQLTHVNVKLHYDLMYVHNCSLWLDICMLARTPLEILRSLRRRAAEPCGETPVPVAVQPTPGVINA